MKKYYRIEFGKDVMPYIDGVIEQLKAEGNHAVYIYVPFEKFFCQSEITEEEYKEHLNRYQNTK